MQASANALLIGKAKRVQLRDTNAEIFFTDRVTANNRAKETVVPGKGELCAQISAFFFEALERQGMATHFIRRLRPDTLWCGRCHMFALEAVVRFAVWGSLAQRTGLALGTLLQKPVLEFYYKRDDLGDPLLNHEHIQMLQLATETEIAQLSHQSKQYALHLRNLCAQVNLNLDDIKFEWGRLAQHPATIVLADEISPDTCRLRDRTSGQIFDKDLFRRDLGDIKQAYGEVWQRLSTFAADRSL